MLDELGWDKDQRFPEWSPDEKTRFGLFVIDVAVEQGLVTSKPVYVRPNYSPRFLDLSPSVWARFNHFQEVLPWILFKLGL